MFLLVSVWDYMCAALCIIDPQDKPFGADLPIEVQNRILWMAWHVDHQDRLTWVHKELETLQVCRLTDWLRVPKPFARFHNPWKMVCNCNECDPEPDCHWCLVYGNKHSSVEFTVLETKLQRIRDSFDCYEEGRYQQFVETYLPIFRDVLQDSLLHYFTNVGVAADGSISIFPQEKPLPQCFVCLREPGSRHVHRVMHPNGPCVTFQTSPCCPTRT